MNYWIDNMLLILYILLVLSACVLFPYGAPGILIGAVVLPIIFLDL